MFVFVSPCGTVIVLLDFIFRYSPTGGWDEAVCQLWHKYTVAVHILHVMFDLCEICTRIWINIFEFYWIKKWIDKDTWFAADAHMPYGRLRYE